MEQVKFVVENITKHSAGAVTVDLVTVASDPEETQADQSVRREMGLRLEMNATAVAAATDQFEQGQEYYVDFTLATEEAAAPP